MSKNDRFKKVYSQGKLEGMEIWIDRESRLLPLQRRDKSQFTELINGSVVIKDFNISNTNRKVDKE